MDSTDEKPLKHPNYIEIITQICRSNYFFSDSGQMFPEKIVGEHLDYDIKKYEKIG